MAGPFQLSSVKPSERYWTHGERAMKSMLITLEGVDDEAFDMGRWWNPKKSCGCIVGHWLIRSHINDLLLRVLDTDGGTELFWVEQPDFHGPTVLRKYLGIPVDDCDNLFTGWELRELSRTQMIERLNYYINARHLERISDADDEAGRVGDEGSSV
jgi:hypothetical protein